MTVDEGGELGQSSKFLRVILQHHITHNTKGGHTSFSNHDERQHRTLTNMIKPCCILDTNQMAIGILLIWRCCIKGICKIYKHIKIQNYNMLHLFCAKCYMYCSTLKIGWRKTLVLQHSQICLLLWVCWYSVLVAFHEAVLVYCEQI